MSSLLFISYQYRPTVGGSIRWAEQLCSDYRGGDVTVLTRELEGPVEPSPDGIRIRRVPLRLIPWLRPESLLLYRKFCAAGIRTAKLDQPAIVAATSVAPDGLIALHLKRRLGLPYVVLAHGEEITVPCNSRRRRVTRFMKLKAMKYAFRCADRVIVNSHNTADTVHDFAGPEVKTQVLHPGTDPELYRPEGDDLRAELSLGTRPVILTVGHLMHRKGQGRVLEALPRVLKQLPEAVYLMAGTGVDEQAMRNLAKHYEVEDSVRFLGHVPQEKLAALYRTADLFVLANRNLPDGDFESFGIVYLEAAACGRPVVVGARTGNADAVIDDVTALRVDPESPEDIAAGFVRLLTDRALARRMGEAGRKFVVDNFAPQVLADQWNEILADVLAKRAAAEEAVAPHGQPKVTDPVTPSPETERTAPN